MIFFQTTVIFVQVPSAHLYITQRSHWGSPTVTRSIFNWGFVGLCWIGDCVQSLEIIYACQSVRIRLLKITLHVQYKNRYLELGYFLYLDISNIEFGPRWIQHIISNYLYLVTLSAGPSDFEIKKLDCKTISVRGLLWMDVSKLGTIRCFMQRCVY